jgi:hypothetical protein
MMRLSFVVVVAVFGLGVVGTATAAGLLDQPG